MRLLIAASAFLTISGFTALGATADHPWPTYPNAAFTPGKVATTEFREVCALDGNLSYSRRHRATANDLKSWIFREYGIAPPQGRLARAEWEIDHRVPLCLGGADEAANLWPQNRTSFRQKDLREARACREVCAARVSLRTAQGWFLGDWTTAPN